MGELCKARVAWLRRSCWRRSVATFLAADGHWPWCCERGGLDLLFCFEGFGSSCSWQRVVQGCSSCVFSQNQSIIPFQGAAELVRPRGRPSARRTGVKQPLRECGTSCMLCCFGLYLKMRYRGDSSFEGCQRNPPCRRAFRSEIRIILSYAGSFPLQIKTMSRKLRFRMR